MRRIIGLLSDIRQHRLNENGASNERLGECRQLFEYMDAQMNGITPTSTNQELAETLVSADFQYAIMEFVQREMVPGYMRKRFDFEPLVWMDTLTNFLPHTRYQVRMGLEDLEYVGTKGTPRPTSFYETKRQYQPYRWEKQIDFAYETIVNDDLGMLEDTVRMMGEAARRTLEKYVSRFYTNATSIARLVGLGALYAQNGRLTTARISEARMAFNQRTDARGEPINARAVYLVVHSGLVDTALQIQRSTQVAELATNAANIVTFTTIEDPYIVGTAPNLPWYMFVDYRENNIRPFVLARMQGVPGPQVFRKRSDRELVTSLLGPGGAVSPMLGDFATANIELMVRDIFGTYIDGTEGNLFDFRGAYYSTGTVP
jgi:hypothetical protein